MVVAPDAGFAKKARLYAQRLKAPLAVADKVREAHDERAHVVDLIGDVEGRDAILVDDFTVRVAGGRAEWTPRRRGRGVVARGARRIFAAVTAHAGVRRVLDGAARRQPHRAPVLHRHRGERAGMAVVLHSKVEVVSVAPPFAEGDPPDRPAPEGISTLFD